MEDQIWKEIIKAKEVDIDNFELLKKFKDNLNENLKVEFVINQIKDDKLTKWINIQVPSEGNNVKTFEDILADSDWKYLRLIKWDINLAL